MTDETKPLYKQIFPCSMEYICTFNGAKCDIISKHFSDYAAAIDFLATNRKNLPFLVSERNLCSTENCPIWNQFLQTKDKQK